MDSLLKNLSPFVLKLKMPDQMRGRIIKTMAGIEYRLSKGCEDRIQLGALVGVLFEVRMIGE